jgi:uncharacterized protein YeaO (DUF488 family)
MAKSPQLRIKRIYDAPSSHDGFRTLVDRLWPRGVKKADARLDAWLKEIAPSEKLRRWFGHDAARWDEFQQRYFEELKQRLDVCEALVERARKQTVTLLYAARDPAHNHALALQTYLRRSARSKRK